MSKGRKHSFAAFGIREYFWRAGRPARWPGPLAWAMVLTCGLIMGLALANVMAGRETRGWRLEPADWSGPIPRILPSAVNCNGPALGEPLPVIPADDAGEARKFWKLGRLAQRQGHLLRAEYYFVTGLQKSPGDPELLISLASLHLEQGNRQGAAVLLNRALEKDSHGLDTLAGFGRFQIIAKP